MNFRSVTFPDLDEKYTIPQTAEDVGALPKTGGEVTGDLAVHKFDILPKTSAYIPGLRILDSDSNPRGGIYSGYDHKMYLSNFSKGTDKAERFYLPAPESGLTDTASYDILTTKTHRINLLWTNASPTSAFAEQTLDLGLSNYSMYIVIARQSTSVNNSISSIQKTGRSMKLIDFDYSTEIGAHQRTVDYSSGSLKFNDAWNNTNKDNTVLIPLFIYGIKGVQ